MDHSPAFVLDTDVVVAALRSPHGASAALLVQALERRFTPVLSVALVLQYEEVCLRPEHRIESGLQEGRSGRSSMRSVQPEGRS